MRMSSTRVNDEQMIGLIVSDSSSSALSSSRSPLKPGPLLTNQTPPSPSNLRNRCACGNILPNLKKSPVRNNSHSHSNNNSSNTPTQEWYDRLHQKHVEREEKRRLRSKEVREEEAKDYTFLPKTNSLTILPGSSSSTVSSIHHREIKVEKARADYLQGRLCDECYKQIELGTGTFALENFTANSDLPSPSNLRSSFASSSPSSTFQSSLPNFFPSEINFVHPSSTTTSTTTPVRRPSSHNRASGLKKPTAITSSSTLYGAQEEATQLTSPSTGSVVSATVTLPHEDSNQQEDDHGMTQQQDQDSDADDEIDDDNDENNQQTPQRVSYLPRPGQLFSASSPQLTLSTSSYSSLETPPTTTTPYSPDEEREAESQLDFLLAAGMDSDVDVDEDTDIIDEIIAERQEEDLEEPVEIEEEDDNGDNEVEEDEDYDPILMSRSAVESIPEQDESLLYDHNEDESLLVDEYEKPQQHISSAGDDRKGVDEPSQLEETTEGNQEVKEGINSTTSTSPNAAPPPPPRLAAPQPPGDNSDEVMTTSTRSFNADPSLATDEEQPVKSASAISEHPTTTTSEDSEELHHSYSTSLSESYSGEGNGWPLKFVTEVGIQSSETKSVASERTRSQKLPEIEETNNGELKDITTSNGVTKKAGSKDHERPSDALEGRHLYGYDNGYNMTGLSTDDSFAVDTALMGQAGGPSTLAISDCTPYPDVACGILDPVKFDDTTTSRLALANSPAGLSLAKQNATHKNHGSSSSNNNKQIAKKSGWASCFGNLCGVSTDSVIE